MRCFLFVSFFILIHFSLFAQTDQLARNYLDQGAYEKALKTYQQLLKENPGNAIFFNGIITSLQELEDFETAEQLLKDRMQSVNSPTLLIELGHNQDLQQKPERAAEYYEKVFEMLQEKPNYTYTVARSFEKYSLLDHAARAYRTGQQLSPESNFDLPLARIYGEQGKLEEMFTAYLDLIDKEPELSYDLIREFDRYILEDPSNTANSVLRKLLLQRLQKNQNVLYNEMLAWLFSQQGEYDKSFVQEKAIYRRNNTDLQRIIQLTVTTRSEGDIETAKDIVSFIIDESPSGNILLQAHRLLMEMEVATSQESDYPAIENSFLQLLKSYGYGRETLELQVDYANFLAFKAGKSAEAIELLEQFSGSELTDFEQAAVKMALADILVLEEKFNQALILYSQVQNLVKNDEISQQARFKVAKTSYYKGDFDWAKTQLDVLKASATQLIANDAMELSLVIRDNSQEDSTQVALKLYARADLLAFQNNNKKAIAVLTELLVQHKGEKIEDEALLMQAALYEAQEDWKNAEANYLNILEFFGQDILSDNATYKLAQLYENQLKDPDKARDFYEKILFEFPDSIYFVAARRNFRQLRGDAIE